MNSRKLYFALSVLVFLCALFALLAGNISSAEFCVALLAAIQFDCAAKIIEAIEKNGKQEPRP